MNKRGGMRMTMSQRVAAGRAGEPGPAPHAEECPARHCWVLDPADGAHVRRPGLLVQWRRTPLGAWEGRVLYLAALRAGDWAVVEEWVPAPLVSAAGEAP
jgi:hypothetical protein